MRLNLIFALIDLLIVLAYPFVFVFGMMRRLARIKR
jgi:hypothetical protein